MNATRPVSSKLRGGILRGKLSWLCPTVARSSVWEVSRGGVTGGLSIRYVRVVG